MFCREKASCFKSCTFTPQVKLDFMFSKVPNRLQEDFVATQNNLTQNNPSNRIASTPRMEPTAIPATAPCVSDVLFVPERIGFPGNPDPDPEDEDEVGLLLDVNVKEVPEVVGVDVGIGNDVTGSGSLGSA